MSPALPFVPETDLPATVMRLDARGCLVHLDAPLEGLPDDGRVLKTLELADKGISGVGWWDDALLFTRNKPSEVLKVSPETGDVLARYPVEGCEELGGAAQLGERLWLCDTYMPCLWEWAPAQGKDLRYKILAGPGPVDLYFQDDTV